MTFSVFNAAPMPSFADSLLEGFQSGQNLRKGALDMAAAQQEMGNKAQDRERQDLAKISHSVLSAPALEQQVMWDKARDYMIAQGYEKPEDVPENVQDAIPTLQQFKTMGQSVESLIPTAQQDRAYELDQKNYELEKKKVTILLKKAQSEIAQGGVGGATGELINRLRAEDPNLSVADALYFIQTGARQGTRLDESGRIVPIEGAGEAKGDIKYKEESGKQRAEVDYAFDKARQQELGSKSPAVESGRKQVSSLLNEMQSDYQDLRKIGAAVSAERPAIENVGAAIGNSPVGQVAGRAVGTKEQVVRDKINTKIPVLINAIRSATGMSAKAMDSNSELQFYLKMATDPKLDIAVNLRALETIENLYGLSAGGSSVENIPNGSAVQPNPVDYKSKYGLR